MRQVCSLFAEENLLRSTNPHKRHSQAQQIPEMKARRPNNLKSCRKHQTSSAKLVCNAEARRQSSTFEVYAVILEAFSMCFSALRRKLLVFLNSHSLQERIASHLSMSAKCCLHLIFMVEVAF